jgi:hypothetical protein
VVVLKGAVRFNDDTTAREAQFVLFGREGGEIRLEADTDASVLILSGEPIEEPVGDTRPLRDEHPRRNPAGDDRLPDRKVRRDPRLSHSLCLPARTDRQAGRPDDRAQT